MRLIATLSLPVAVLAHGHITYPTGRNKYASHDLANGRKWTSCVLANGRKRARTTAH
eukprot:SAG11_NODE_929_length_6503_cov_9.709557_1_plen_57_part_00